jgi:hypothetical protein
MSCLVNLGPEWSEMVQNTFRGWILVLQVLILLF